MAPAPEPEADADGATTARDVVRGAVATSLALLVAHLPAARDGDVRGVHQSRVALRRLRSDLRTFEPLFDTPWADDLRSRIRELARTLGAVRDDDVHLDLIRRSARRAGVGVAGVVEHLQHDRERHRAALVAMLDAPATAKLLDDLHAAAADPLTGPAANGSADDVLAPLVRKRWKRLRREIAALDKEPRDHELHRVRIRAKRVRYAAMAVTPVYGPPAARLAKRLGRMQDTLGVVNDAAALSARLHAATDRFDLAEALAAGEVLGRLGADADAARAQWRDDWRRASAKRLRRWM